MELSMTNGFCELNNSEMLETDGGIAWIIPVIVIGIATLTGCSSKKSDIVADVGNKRDVQIHTGLGCTSSGCTYGANSDCPVYTRAH